MRTGAPIERSPRLFADEVAKVVSSVTCRGKVDVDPDDFDRLLRSARDVVAQGCRKALLNGVRTLSEDEQHRIARRLAKAASAVIVEALA
jgi:hypothetical protein